MNRIGNRILTEKEQKVYTIVGFVVTTIVITAICSIIGYYIGLGIKKIYDFFTSKNDASFDEFEDYEDDDEIDDKDIEV